ncbi:MAG: hypothetical protein ACFE0O_11985 [Opitutales bacterium]
MIRKFIILGVLAFLNYLPGHAAIVVTGPFTSPGATIEFSTAIPLTVTTTSSNGFFLVFDDWVSSDASSETLTINPASLAYRVNGGAQMSVPLQNISDNFTNSNGDVSPDDGLLGFNTLLSVTAGDVIEIVPQTLTTTNSSADFNSALDGITFSGDVFLADLSLNELARYSASPIPEPRYFAAVFGLIALGLVVRRSRKGQ